MSVGFSVVIPCYNVEKYITSCLDSIRSSNYSDLEVIVVDDRSTDRTLEVIQEYIQMNRFPVTVLNNEKNLGAGMTRNRGIAAASKEYMVFVDADDTILPALFQSAASMIEEYESDCVVFDAIRIIGKGHTYVKMFQGGTFSRGLIAVKDALVFIKGATWGKVYRTSLIKENRAQFADIKRFEDLAFTKTAVSYCSRVTYLPEAYYIYSDNAASLTHNRALLDKIYAVTAYDMIFASLNGRGFDEELQAIYMIEMVYSTTMTMIRQGTSSRECRRYCRQVMSGHGQGGKYFSQFEFKYRLMLGLMRTGAFGLIRGLLRLKEHP